MWLWLQVRWKCACQWFNLTVQAEFRLRLQYLTLTIADPRPCPGPWPEKSSTFSFWSQIGEGLKVAHWSDLESSPGWQDLDSDSGSATWGLWTSLRQALDSESDQAAAAALPLRAGPSWLSCRRVIAQTNHRSPSTANWHESHIQTASALMEPPSLIELYFVFIRTFLTLYNGE